MGVLVYPISYGKDHMNLLTRETPESTIRHFRVQQYMLYQELIGISVKYLINFGLMYDPDFYDVVNNPVNIQQDYSYRGESHYSSDLLTIRLFPEAVSKDYLLYAYMPRLLDETFFRLNGSYFVPIFFISDEPIVLKTKSISVYSLFQPISLYLEDNRVTFMQDNYELSDFIQALIYDWDPVDVAKIEQHVKLTPNRDKKIWQIVGNKLKCNPNPVDIKSRINQLVFDDWTYELYETYYGMQPSIDMILKLGFDKLLSEFQPKFGDLRYKRLTFIEPLMKGYFKRVSNTARLLLNRKSIRSLMFPQNGFTKHFFKELDGQTFYDTVNGFSSVISHKASFKNPASTSKLPKSVSELHESHKCRICSNTIGNQKPGQMVSLVPDQDIDNRFGIFEKNDYQMRNFT